MNKIFKVIWNQVTQQFVVVSELAHAKGKTASSTDESVSPVKTAYVLGGVSLAVLGAGYSHDAEAAYSATGTGTFDTIVISPNTALAASVGGSTNATAIGGGARAGNQAVALGSGANASATQATAVGRSSTATDEAIALGMNATASGARASSLGVHSVANNTQSVALGYKTVASGSQSTALGSDSIASGASSIAIGGDDLDITASSTAVNNIFTDVSGSPLVVGQYQATTASGSAAVAVGVQAVASGNLATAFGTKSVASGDTATALGVASTASGQGALAAAPGSKASGKTSIALGALANATQENSVAISEKAQAIGTNSVAIGQQSNASAANATAIGSESISSGNDAVAIGTKTLTTATAISSVALGHEAEAGGLKSVSVGYNATSTSQYGIAIGSESKSLNNSSVAVGELANASGVNAYALGKEAIASGLASYAIGEKASATNNKSIAIGSASQSSGDKSIAVGDGANATNTHSFAMGGQSLSTGTNALAIGSNTKATGNFSIAQGNAANATALHAQAMGVEAVASANYATAVGSKATASAVNSFAGGRESSASGAQAVALGNKAAASGGSAVAIGNESVASKNNAVATGWRAQATGDNAVALGREAKAESLMALALGNNAVANLDRSVALGAYSTVSGAVQTNSATVGDITYSGFAGSTPATGDVVSVGEAAGRKRQIQNVAAGQITATSTDAINGSQLYVTNSVLSTLANSVKTEFGGNAALNANTGEITFSNIGNTGKDTIHDAIAAVKEDVVAGSNVVVTPVTAANGSTTYTVHAKDTTANHSAASADFLTVTAQPQANNVTNYETALTPRATDALKKAETAVQNIASPDNSVVVNKVGDTTNLQIRRGLGITVDSNGGVAVANTKLDQHATNMRFSTPRGQQNSFVKADDLARHLNNVGFNLSGEEMGGTFEDLTTDVGERQIRNGDVLSIYAGPNMKINQVRQGYEFSVAGVDVAYAGNKATVPDDAESVATAKSVAEAINHAGFTLKTSAVAGGEKVSGTDEVINPADIVDMTAGKNLTVKQDVNGKITYATKDDVEFTSVKAGPVTINNNGIDAGNKVINNVAPAELSATSTQAVNGSQLFATNNNVTNNANNIATNTQNIANNAQNIANNAQNIANNAQNIQTNADNIAKGINFGGTTGSNNYALGSTINVKGDSDITSETVAGGAQLSLSDTVKANLTKASTAVQNFKVAVNGTDIQTVSDGQTVKFVDGTGTTAKAVGEAVTFDVNKGGLTTNDAGNVTSNKAGDNFVTGDDVAKAINEATARTEKTTTVVEGSNTHVKSNVVGNNTEYTVSADKSTVSVSGALTKTESTATDANGAVTTNYALDLSQTTKENIQKGVDAKDTVDNKGLTFTGDSGSTNVEKLGSTVAVNGDKNITTEAADDAITIKLKDDITVNTVTANTTTTSNLTVKPNGSVDMGNNQITNVASGGDVNTNAANIGDVKNARTVVTSNDSTVKIVKTSNGLQDTYDLSVNTSVPTTALTTNKGNVETPAQPDSYVTAGNLATTINSAVASAKEKVVAGTNIASVDSQVDDATGATTYTVNAKGTTASAGSDKVKVTPIGKADNITDYAVDLSDTAKASLDKADTAVQSFTTSVNGTQAEVIDQANKDVNFVNGTGTTARNDGGNITFDVNKGGLTTNDAGNVTSNKAGDNFVTGDDVAKAINEATARTEKTTTVVEGSNTHVKSNVVGNNTEYTVSADKSTVSVSETLKMEAKPTTDANEAVTTEYALDLSDKTKEDIKKGVDAKETVDNKGLTFTGDSGSTNVEKLGSTVAVNGDTNIVTSAAGDAISIKLKDDITVNSVTANTTTTTNLTVKPNGNVDMGNNQITNVASGGDVNTNAANIGDVKKAKTEVKAGTNIVEVKKTTGDNGQDIYTIDAKDTTATHADSSKDFLTVSDAQDKGGNVKNFETALTTRATTALKAAETAVQSFKVAVNGADVQTVANGDTVKFVNGTGTTARNASGQITFDINKSTLTTDDAGNVTNNTAGDTFVTGDDVAKAINEAAERTEKTTTVVEGSNTHVQAKEVGNNTEYTVSADKATVSTSAALKLTKTDSAPDANQAVTTDYNIDLSDETKAQIAKEESVVEGDNVTVTEDGTNSTGGKKFKVALNKNLDLGNTGSVTTGNTTVNNDGVKVGNNTLTNAPITVNGNLVTNVNEAINKTAEQAFNPLTFAGDSGTEFNRKLGQKVSVKGGADAAKLSDGNIGVVANGADTLEVKLSKELKELTSAEFKDAAGNTTVINGAGTTITPTNGGNTVSLTTTGLNNGGNLITNVASGGDVNTNAANIGDVKKAKTEVKAGTNIVDVVKTEGGNGQDIYTVNAKDTTATHAESSKDFLTVSDAQDKGGNVKNFETALTTRATDALQAAETAVQNFKVAVNGADVQTVANGDTVKFVNGTGTTARNASGQITFDINKSTLTTDDAGNVTNNNAGDTFVTGDDVAKAINEAAERTEKTTSVVKGSNTHVQSKVDGNNTEYTVSADKSTVSVSDALKMQATPTTDGTTEAVTTDYALDLSDKTKDDIKKGVDAKDIVDNKGLTFTGDSGSTNVEKLGSTVAVNGDTNIATSAQGDQISIKLKDDITVNSVTANTVKAGDTTINNNGVTINNGTAGNPVTLTKDGLNNGGNKITNVANGTAPNDAVNVSQLEKAQKAAATEVVSYDESIKVTEEVGENGQTIYDLAVSVDDTTIETDGDGKLRVKTTELKPEANGKVAEPSAEDAPKLVNAGDIAKAINASGFNVKSGGNKADGDDETSTLINPGEEVTFTAGDNLKVKRVGNEFSFETAKDVAFDKVTVGPVTLNKDSGIDAGNTNITNVKSNLAPVTPIDEKQPDANSLTNLADKLNNAATVADVLNAGWNLQNNDTAIDTVTHNDAVNFINGRGTTVSVTANDDGTVNDVQVDIETDDKTITVQDGKLAAVTTPITQSTDGKATTNGDTTSLVTGDQVANAINNSGLKFEGDKADAGATANNFARNNQETAKVLGGAEGELSDNNIGVVSNGVDALTVKLAKDLKDLTSANFTNATGNTTVNGNGITITPTTGDQVSLTDKGLDNGNNQIKNVAAGTALTDAVNVSQLRTEVAASQEEVVSRDGSISVQSEVNPMTKATVFDVSVNVDNATITKDKDGQLTANTVNLTNDENGKVNAPTVGGQDAGKSLVTAQTVTNAINNSGFTLTTGQQESGLTSSPDTKELINPGKEVKMIAGDNLVVAQEGGNIAYSLRPNINIESVQFNNGPKITNDGNNIKVSQADGSATKITNVADGDVNADSKDAVNGSQLHTAITNINNNITESTQTYFHTNNGTNIGGDATTNLGGVNQSAGATALGSLAAGIRAKATGENGVAVGSDSLSSLSSVAVGSKSKAEGRESVAIGLESSSSAWRTTAIGYQAEATVESANALGNQAKATNWGATAVGTIANASGINSSALGNNASSSGSLSLAVGTSANATGNYSTAVGTLSNAKAYGAIGTGLHSYASGQNAIATGSYSVADGIASIATGWEAVATGRLTTAVGYNAKADNNQAIAVGTNSVSPSSYAISIGSNTGGLAHGAVALGRDAIAGGDAALKQKATAYFDKLDAYTAKERILATTSPTASSYNRHKTEAEALKAELDVLKTEYDAAVEAAFTKGEYATALGAYAQAEHKDSVALGSYSTTAEAVSTNNATVNGISYSGFAGNVATATVSVGKEGTYRTITNVAAGRISATSTDAINGSQLYAVANAIPATYTTTAGAPLVKIGDKFYKPADIPADGSAPAANKAVDPTDVMVSLISPNASQTANAATTLANVKSNLAPVTPIDEKQPDVNSLANLAGKLNNAATVADVLNAGWNLQNNDTAIDTVTHNDAVNFVNGRGTTVSVTANDDGTVNNIQVDSALGYVNTDANDTSTPSNTVKVFGKDDAPVQITNVASGVRNEDGTAPVGQELAEAIKNATGDTLNNAVNVGDLKAAVNASKTEVVSYDESIKVTEEVGENGQTIYDLAVSVDDTTIETDGDGKLRVKTTELKPEANGKVAEPSTEDAPKLVNAGDIAKAINASGFNVKSGGNKAAGDEADATLINPGEEVTFTAGDNLKVKRVGNEFSFETAKDVAFDKVTVGPVTLNKDSGIDAGNTNITNVKSNLAPVTPIDEKQPDANSLTNLANKLNNAATVADVLNAGWNLQNNDTAIDTVTHNDAVNFVNGRGTTVSVTANDDGTVNNIQVDSALGYVNTDANDTSTPSNTVKVFGKDDAPVQITNVASGVRNEDGTAPVGQELAEAIKNATGDTLNNAVNVGDLKAAVNASKTEVVSYDESIKVTEEVGENGQTIYDLAVSVDDTTIETDGKGKLRVKTTELKPETNAENNPTGKVAEPSAEDAPKLVNAGDIAKAINASGFNVKSGGNKADGDDETSTLINPGEEVTFTAGNNLKVKRVGNEFSFETAKDVAFDKVTVGPVMLNKDSGIDAGNTNITNVKSNLAPVTPIDEKQPDANSLTNLANKLNNAATVADVLNAGWNLQNNDTAIDTVTHNDAVNFVNGRGTTVSVTANDDGTVNNIQVDSALGYVNTDANDTSTPSNTVKVFGKDDAPVQITNVASGVRNEDGTAPVGQELAEAIKNATGDTLNNAVNVGDLKAAVNASKTEVVSYDESIKVTEEVGENGQTIYDLAVSVDDTTIETDGNGKLRVKTTELKPETNAENNPTGKVAEPSTEDAPKLVNAGDIAKAINASGFNVKSGGNKADGDDETSTLINPGEEVTFTAGNNLKVKRVGNEFSFETAKDVAFDKVTVGPVTLNKDSGIDAGNTNITNVKSNLAPVTPIDEKQPDANSLTNLADKLNNAATVADVLNAGWNLQNNDTAIDTVTHNDAVNFINGRGTTVSVTANDDGTVNNIQVDSALGYVNTDANDTSTPSNTVKVFGKDDAPVQITNVASGVRNEDGTAPVGQELAEAIKNATGDTLNNAVNVGDLKAAVNTAIAASQEDVVSTDGSISVQRDVNPVTKATTFDVSVNVDNTTITKDKDGQLTANTVNLSNDETGKVNNPTVGGQDVGKSLVTAQTVKDAINNSGWNLAADGTVGKELVNPGETVTFKTGSDNLTVKRDGANITYDLAKDITVDSVKAGNTTVNNDGITIENAEPNKTVSLTNSGLNNGGNKITNVAAGEADDDAVNVSQLNKAINTAVAASQEDVVSTDGSISVQREVNPVTKATTFDVSVNVDNTTITKDKDGQLTANTVNLTNDETGKVNNPTVGGQDVGKSLVTAQTVTDAINNSGFKAKANGDEGELINPGDEVEFINGRNIEITRDGGKFTVATAKEVKFDSVQLGDNGPKLTNDGNNIKLGDKDGNATSITNVKSNLAPVTPIDEKQPDANNPTNLADKLSNAATVADVLNAGWNLQNNDTAIDTVTHNDAVNFINGRGTTVSVTANDDGTVNNIQVDSALGYVNTDATDTSTPSNTVKVFGKDDAPVQITNVASGVRNEDGTAPVGQELAEAIKNATGDTLNNAVNVGDLQSAVNAATTTVEGSQNVDVTSETNVNGSTNYIVNVNTGNMNVTQNGKVDYSDLTDAMKDLADAIQSGDSAAIAAASDNLSRAGNAVATTANVQDTVNNSGWTTTLSNGTKALVNPGDQVNYINGNGTDANVTVNRVQTGTEFKDVSGNTVYKTGNNSYIYADGRAVTGSVTETPVYQDVVSVTYDVTQTQLQVSNGTQTHANGTLANQGEVITPDEVEGNKFVNATNLAQAINSAGWNVQSQKVTGSTGEVATGSTSTPTKVSAGNTVNVNAGNNIVITRTDRDIAIATSMKPVFDNVTVGGTNGVQLSASTANDGVKELNIGTSGKETRITNVAPGMKETDAVNVGQLEKGLGNVRNQINKVDKRVRGVGANAAAGMSLPQVYIPGKSMVAASAGTYGGESAVAVGYSRASDNGKVILKVTGTANSQGHFSGGVGVGYQW